MCGDLKIESLDPDEPESMRTMYLVGMLSEEQRSLSEVRPSQDGFYMSNPAVDDNFGLETLATLLQRHAEWKRGNLLETTTR